MQFLILKEDSRAKDIILLSRGIIKFLRISLAFTRIFYREESTYIPYSREQKRVTIQKVNEGVLQTEPILEPLLCL